MMKLDPSYECHLDKSRYKKKTARSFDAGLCGRLVQPQGVDVLMVKEAMRRFVNEGWTIPEDVAYIDVRYDPCIADAAGCRSQYTAIGFAGAAFAAITALLIIGPCLTDAY